MNAYVRGQCQSLLSDWLSYRARQRLIPGFSVAVSVDGKTLYHRAFGFADIPTGQQLTSKNVFCIGSQSKMLTAILVMQLIEAGLLQAHDRAATFLPWLGLHHDRQFAAITIEQLLWHGAGLARDGQQADFWQLLAPFPDQVALRQSVLKSELVAASGDDIKYSNLGYALLGQVIEAASGQSYEKLAIERIITPLGLTDTFVDYHPARDHQIATGHTRHIDGQRHTVRRNVPIRTYAAVTGWYSTPGDMLRIMAALHNNTLLSQDSKDSMLSGQRHHWRPPETSRGEYGLGFMQQKIDGQRLFGHSGGFLAHRTCSYFMPDARICVSVMTNAGDAPINQIAAGIFDIVARLASDSSTGSIFADYDILLENMLGAKRIFVLGNSLKAIALDNWSPLDNTETLAVIDAHTLRIVRSNFLAVPDELITYHRTDGALTSANYAGHTIWPRDVFLKNYKPSI